MISGLADNGLCGRQPAAVRFIAGYGQCGARPPACAVIEAARNAKVGQIVYTGLANPENMNMGLEKLHLASEYMLRLTGIPFTILRNTFYLEILANPGLKGSLASGELISATQGGRVNFALRSDMARAAAVVLTTPATKTRLTRLPARRRTAMMKSRRCSAASAASRCATWTCPRRKRRRVCRQPVCRKAWRRSCLRSLRRHRGRPVRAGHGRSG
jgi:uncharacterized protein YbjT (DUF2867 family)